MPQPSAPAFVRLSALGVLCVIGGLSQPASVQAMSKTTDNGVSYLRLFTDAATASSAQPRAGQGDGHANYAFDGDLQTAWSEGVRGYGAGESLTFVLSPMTAIRAIKVDIANGDQRGRAEFRRAGAAKRLELQLFDQSDKPVFRRKLSLTKSLGWQSFVITLPQVTAFRRAALVLVTSHTGGRQRTTSISEVRLSVDNALDVNPELEHLKRDRLAQWVIEHAAAKVAARKKTTGTYFATARFLDGEHAVNFDSRTSRRGLPKDISASYSAAQLEDISRAFTAHRSWSLKKPGRALQRSDRVTLPKSVPYAAQNRLMDLGSMLDARRLRFVSAQSGTGPAAKSRPRRSKALHSSTSTQFGAANVQWNGSAVASQITLHGRLVLRGRGTREMRSTLVYRYGADGLLDFVVQVQQYKGLRHRAQLATLSFERDGADKIATLHAGEFTRHSPAGFCAAGAAGACNWNGSTTAHNMLPDPVEEDERGHLAARHATAD